MPALSLIHLLSQLETPQSNTSDTGQYKEMSGNTFSDGDWHIPRHLAMSIVYGWCNTTCATQDICKDVAELLHKDGFRQSHSLVIGIQIDKLKAASFQNSFNHLHNQRRQVHIDIYILNPVFCEFDQLHLLNTSSDLPTFLWEGCQWQLASTLKCLLVKLAQSY